MSKPDEKNPADENQTEAPKPESKPEGDVGAADKAAGDNGGESTDSAAPKDAA